MTEIWPQSGILYTKNRSVLFYNSLDVEAA